MRISIIGMPASGKSTLARAISKKLAIPHIHLDRFWFESGGKTGEHDTPNINDVRARVKSRVLDAIANDSWVSDGFYSRVQPFIADRADVVIFLDIPLWRRLLAYPTRALWPQARHPELSWWDDVKFFGEIIRRNFSKREKFDQFAQAHKNKIITFHSWKEADEYLAGLSPSNAK